MADVKYLSTQEASQFLNERGVSIRQHDLARMASSGLLQGALKGDSGAWRIPEQSLLDLLPRKKFPKNWKIIAGVTTILLPMILAAPSFIKDGIELYGESFERNVTVHVSLKGREATPVEKQAVSEGAYREMSYKATEGQQGLVIGPDMSFDELVAQENGGPYTVRVPELDIKLTNNSATTKYISALELQVVSSETDLRPVPRIAHGDKPGEFWLENEGWGAMLDGSLELTAEVGGETANYDFREISLRKAMPCGPFVKAIGGNPEVYASVADTDSYEDRAQVWQTAVGPKLIDESNDRPLVNVPTKARSTCFYKDGFGKRRSLIVNFKTTLQLSAEWPGYGDGEVEQTAQVLLRESGANYSITYPLSVPSKAKDITRVSVRVAAVKSSRHKFRVSLICTDGTVINCPTDIDLRFFLTKSGRTYLEEGLGEEAI